MRTGRPSGALVAVMVLAACVVGSVVFTLAGWGSDETRAIASCVVFAVVGLASTVFLWVAARHPALDASTRLTWSLLACGVGANYVGGLMWLAYEVVLQSEPFPSPADAAYLAYYVLVLGAWVSVPRTVTVSRVERTRTLLDAGTAIVAAGMIIWYLVISPIVRTGGEGGFIAIALSVAYPILDVLLLLAAVHAWAVKRFAVGEGVARILVATLFVGLAVDLLFSIQSLEGTYRAGGIADAAFMLWVGGFGLAGYAQYRALSLGAKPGGVDSRTRHLSFLPYAAIVAAFGLLVYAVRDQLATEIGHVLVGAFILTAVVIVRQTLSLRARRKTEEELRRSRELLQAVVEASPVAIAATDVDMNMTLWSPAAERIFGWTTEELLGQPWPAVPPDKQEESDAIRDRWLRGEDLGVVDMVRLRKDGSLVEIESRFARLLNAAGEVIGSVSVMEDVTTERQVEKQLRTLVESAPMAVIMTDVEENVLLWNPAAERIFGWTEAEVLGGPLPYVSPEMYEESEGHRLRSVAGLTHPGLEIRRRRKDGRLIDLQLWSAPLRDVEGRVVGLMGLLRDVTEEKQVQQQLRQSQKMEAVGQLAGGIAHDFNNLLTAIIGNAELLLRKEESGRDHSEVTEIKRAAERAGVLTQQILAFSRRQTLQPRVVAINDVVAGAATLLRSTLSEDVDLRFDLDPQAGLVEVDPHQLEQVLMNLVVNGRDAVTPGGTLLIRTTNLSLDEAGCHTHQGIDSGEYVLLSVTDDGCGMDGETLSHVFEPFFTTKPIGQGTGLGLATVHGIVTQSGGSVSIVSSLGVGTTVKVLLPRRETQVVRRDQETSSPRTLHQGNETILVVEDEPAVSALVKRVLTRQGYRVLTAGCGAELETALGEPACRIDLLLSDVLLPGSMQGPAVAEFVRERCGDVPVLFMSGYPREVIVREGRLQAGINLLEKPFSPDALALRVREVLDSR